jgi:hypothetical protein
VVDVASRTTDTYRDLREIDHDRFFFASVQLPIAPSVACGTILILYTDTGFLMLAQLPPLPVYSPHVRSNETYSQAIAQCEAAMKISEDNRGKLMPQGQRNQLLNECLKNRRKQQRRKQSQPRYQTGWLPVKLPKPVKTGPFGGGLGPYRAFQDTIVA